MREAHVGSDMLVRVKLQIKLRVMTKANTGAKRKLQYTTVKRWV